MVLLKALLVACVLVVVYGAKCGDKKFDPADYRCCEGKILKAWKKEECCGNRLYPTDVFKCCDNIVVYAADRSAKCCKDRTDYDKSKKICCMGNLADRQGPNGGTDLKCCGIRSYDPRFNNCCNDRVC